MTSARAKSGGRIDGVCDGGTRQLTRREVRGLTSVERAGKLHHVGLRLRKAPTDSRCA